MTFFELWNLGVLFRATPEARSTVDMVLIVLGVVFTIVASYLLGSINLSIIISSKFYNDDIRNHGSGNAGFTNIGIIKIKQNIKITNFFIDNT